MPQTALKYSSRVEDDGRVESIAPFPPGTRLIVVEDQDLITYELTKATESSLGFWDNPWDEEDWNEHATG
ncbi:MAG: hypothetical protein GXP42_05665 [Chloroflexi bacterium]|nr:hypothetical protein [Chloroflexota bacterium]